MEKFTPKFEQEIEKIPTVEEVREVFDRLREGKNVEGLRRDYDEKGLYLWEIKIIGENDHEHTEYLYRRKGSAEKGDGGPTAIHVTYYEDDFPVSGTTAARYDEKSGSWRIIE
jgi:hypothetical protein